MKILYNNGTRPISINGLELQPKQQCNIDLEFIDMETISAISSLVNANMLEIIDVKQPEPTPVLEEVIQEEIIEPIIDEQNIEVVEKTEVEKPIKKTTRKTTTKKKTTK